MNYEDDISLDLARAAHAGTSFTPDKRAAQTRADYAGVLSEFRNFLDTQAAPGNTAHLVAGEFDRFRAGYAKRFRAYLASRSHCMSTMIAGPSNFPVRRMNKRNAITDKRLDELLQFARRARTAAGRALRPDLRPIMSGDADALERLGSKLVTLEQQQRMMKDANAAIRRTAKRGAEAQVAALVELGLPQSIGEELIKPDFAQRIGFADYQLTNNSAEIRRIKARMVQLERAHSTPIEEREANGIALEVNHADNRVRLTFPGKPDEATRTRMKRAGYRWSPTAGVWQAYVNASALDLAAQLVPIEA